MLLLNINMKPYMGSPFVQLHSTLVIDLERLMSKVTHIPKVQIS